MLLDHHRHGRSVVVPQVGLEPTCARIKSPPFSQLNYWGEMLEPRCWDLHVQPSSARAGGVLSLAQRAVLLAYPYLDLNQERSD